MTPMLDLSEARLRQRYPFWKLLTPTGGLLSGVTRLANEPSAPDFEIAVSNLGNLSKAFSYICKPDGRDAFDEPLGGAGADLDPELAWLRAVMEGAERYANMVYQADDFVVASASELGDAAIDLDRVARCSVREYATGNCPYVPADKAAPIRWARGYSLRDRRQRMVPAVMSHLYTYPWPAERFWQEISTGVAAHVRPEAAMLSAICEVIERDAVAISWLARLPLPRITFPKPLPPELAANLRALDRSQVRQQFFDATSDIGVPTVYAVQLLDGHPATAQYVNCTAGFSAVEACAKTIREAAPARPVLREVTGVPRDSDDFRSLYDGAHRMGRPAARSAFDFLLQTPREVPLRDVEIGAIGDGSERARLRLLVDRLAALDLDVVVVDLTTDELREVGIWVVRAVVPGLMPMSSVQRGRFLGTPRLYDYPAKAGFGRLCEDDINRLPQPFA